MILIVALSTSAITSLSPIPASAAPSTPQACQARVALEARKFFGSTYKARQQCQDDVVRRKLPGATNCATESKAASKIDRAAAKLDTKIRAQCTDAHVAECVEIYSYSDTGEGHARSDKGIRDTLLRIEHVGIWF